MNIAGLVQAKKRVSAFPSMCSARYQLRCDRCGGADDDDANHHASHQHQANAAEGPKDPDNRNGDRGQCCRDASCGEGRAIC